MVLLRFTTYRGKFAIDIVNQESAKLSGMLGLKVESEIWMSQESIALGLTRSIGLSGEKGREVAV